MVMFCTGLPVKLAYLNDSNAPAHSVDSDIFQGSDSSICALLMTHRWRVVTRDRDKKSHYNLNYD